MSCSRIDRQFYAETYDACVGDWPGEIDFYLGEVIERTASKPCRVLELACGTGRIAIRLAKAGADIVGLDRSEEMLEVARKKSAGVDNIRWVQADMRSFDLDELFDLVIIPAHSFQNLNDPDEQIACVQSLCRHLNIGGTLILHLDHQNHQWLGEIGGDMKGVFEPAEEFTHPLTGNQIKTSRSWSFHRSSQTAIMHMVWKEYDNDGKLIREVDTGPVYLHCIFYHEVVHILARAGFEVEHVFGDFEGNPLDDDSDQMIWVARKPGECV